MTNTASTDDHYEKNLLLLTKNFIIEVIVNEVILQTTNSSIRRGFSNENQPPLNSSGAFVISVILDGGLSIYHQKTIAYSKIIEIINNENPMSVNMLFFDNAIISIGVIIAIIIKILLQPSLLPE